jgi:hypothetical protein
MRKLVLGLLVGFLAVGSVVAKSSDIWGNGNVSSQFAYGTDVRIGSDKGYVYQIITTDSTAGDYICLFNSASSSVGTPLLEIYFGTNNETKTIDIPKGIYFSTGIYLVGSERHRTTVVYEKD